MKRIAMLFMGAVFSLYSFVTNGQTTLGVKGGVNIANMTAKDVHNYGYKPRVSGHAGIYVNHMFNKKFAIQPEVLFSGEGQHYVYNSVEHTTALNYLEIPLMFQVYPIKDLYLEAGPQFGLLLSAKDKITGQDLQPNIKSAYATAQFSIAAGVGFRVADRVIIYGRYNTGLTDMMSYDPNIIQHGHVIQLGVAVRFKTL